MNTKQLIEAYTQEVKIKENAYALAIDQAIDLLKAAKDRKATTHLGHNLGNRAAELSVIAAQLDATEMALRMLTVVIE